MLIHALVIVREAPARCRCGQPYAEDPTVAAEAELYAPGAVIRQWRCLSGHSLTVNLVSRPAAHREAACDVCGEPMLRPRTSQRRHQGACAAEHERRRKTPQVTSGAPPRERSEEPRARGLA